MYNIIAMVCIIIKLYTPSVKAKKQPLMRLPLMLYKYPVGEDIIFSEGKTLGCQINMLISNRGEGYYMRGGATGPAVKVNTSISNRGEDII